jgi:large subunit ribosomal protein L20
MPRVKRGVTTKARHKRLLKRTEGFRMTYNRLIRRAHEADLHAGQYAFAGRKLKKRDMRSIWIVRLNGVLRDSGAKYSTFINALKKQDIQLNRKTLSQMAFEDPKGFSQLVQKVMG